MNSFTWRLSALMEEHKLEQTSALRPLLEARGVALSREQVFRLVKYAPERLSMETLVALCDIFNCTPNDLVDLHVGPRSSASPARTKPGKIKIAGKRVQLR